MSRWAVIALPWGDPVPYGRAVLGPRRPRREAEQRADELAEISAGRWPVDFVVVELDDRGRVRTARRPNPAKWGDEALQWARSSLERVPSSLQRPRAIGALMSESELTRGELQRLAREAAAPDPERSQAAKQRAAIRKAVQAAVASEGGDALPDVLAEAVKRGAYELVSEGATVDDAVGDLLDKAAQLEQQALELGQQNRDAAEETFLEAAAASDDLAERVLLEGAAKLAAVAPDRLPLGDLDVEPGVCRSGPGEPETIEGASGDQVVIVVGADVDVFVPSQAGGLQTLPAQYALIDVDDLQISHDPVSFRPTDLRGDTRSGGADRGDRSR